MAPPIAAPGHPVQFGLNRWPRKREASKSFPDRFIRRPTAPLNRFSDPRPATRTPPA
jgi:hypothetical protein